MQKVRRHPVLANIGLRPLVSVRFQVLLTRLIAVLFIFQSPYLCTIGHRGIFSLGPDPVAYGTFTLYGLTFQTVPLGSVL